MVTGIVCRHRLRFNEGNTTKLRIEHEIFTHIHSDT
jgi:hypothetical protein